ncbi:type IV secretory system conjugative DNA transfer family protein [Algoriphagus vanfongensis]|uniref:type IV secretory system conjugative DNA transfer family protein n=1 Tax=Algoriphagus vanfongensis TaxID=426371 RepID=UPI0004059ECE|nr:type IV secretory system conjugative DNA transfer family protein [Algoriphagus vanfongensis]
MNERRELKSLHGTFQFVVYLMVFMDILMFVYAPQLTVLDGIGKYFFPLFEKLLNFKIYQNVLLGKIAILVAIALSAIGTAAKKNLDLNPRSQIVFPITLGFILFFGSVYIYTLEDSFLVFDLTSMESLGYILSTLIGSVLIHTSLDNVSKMIKSGLGKDEWNIEGESFLQDKKKLENPFSVNIPMKFYYRGKVHKGWINLVNPFRGTFVIGTPGSGKSFGVINPFIRQMIGKGFTMCLYDFKFPDLAQIAYFHYLKAQDKKKNSNFKFHVINLDEVEYSRRINPINRRYIKTVANASETAEAIFQSLQKSDSSGGADRFFEQSAINFLSACIFFVSRYEDGKYSTFAHVLDFLNRDYEDIFNCLTKHPELRSMVSPFRSAYEKKVFKQLEGQVGTLKIFLSRLNTKETAWVFSGDDFDLKISDLKSPSILVLANSTETQSITGTCYSVIINRLTRLINTKGNLPTALIADEAPTFYIHKIENLISTARSNKVAVLLGLQELPQLNQLQGKDTASTMTSVIGNVLCGSVRHKDTLSWLEMMFGKRKQLGQSVSIDRHRTSVSYSEKYEPLIPAGKIASMHTGEIAGIIATEGTQFDGKYKTSNIHCRVNLNMKEIKQEESSYRTTPKYYDFKGKKEEILTKHFEKIHNQVTEIIEKHREMAPVE